MRGVASDPRAPGLRHQHTLPRNTPRFDIAVGYSLLLGIKLVTVWRNEDSSDGCGSTQCCLAPHYELLKCFPQQKYLSGANMILFQVCAGLSDKKAIRNIMRYVFYSLLHCCCLRSVGVTNGNSGHPRTVLHRPHG